MKNEQTIHTTTVIKLSFIDTIKVLLGKRIEVKIYSTIPFSTPEIVMFNSHAHVAFVRNSKYKIVDKSHRDFGYSPVNTDNL